MANFLSKLFSAGASSFVDAVSDAIDKNFTSDEEKRELENELARANMQHQEVMGQQDLDRTKAYLADTASARENQTAIQQSEHASWLAKNVHSLLAVSIIGLTFFMFFWIIQGDGQTLLQNGMKDIVIYILGALTTIATQVVAYYFGSSQGSKDKQKSIDSITSGINKK